MDNKNYVFDKFELGLLVIFFVLLSITSFVLGHRYGQKQVSSVEQTTSQVVPNIVEEVQSDERKLNDEIKLTLAQRLRKKDEVKEMKAKVENDIVLKKNSEATLAFDELEEKVEQAFNEKTSDEVETFESDKTASANELSNITKEDADKIVQEKIEGFENPAQEIVTKVKNKIDTIEQSSEQGYSLATKDLIGKYTIQLGSYKTLDEARDSASDYIAKNYKPIINEVELSGRGKWFRVSLGVFDSQISANRYVKRESAIFDNKKYYVTVIE